MGQEHFVPKPPVESQHVGIRAHHVAKSEEYKTYIDFEVLKIVNFLVILILGFGILLIANGGYIFVVLSTVLVVKVNAEIYLPVMPEKTRGTVGHPEGE